MGFRRRALTDICQADRLTDMDYTRIITIEPGKRSGGMTVPELLADFPELTADDVRACLAFAAAQLPGSAA